MRVGIIGTGAISVKHAEAYKSIGFEITVCTNQSEAKGRQFAEHYGAEFVRTYEEVCRHPKVDYVDLCTFPDFRLQAVHVCAETKKHVLVQKPMATNLDTARDMIRIAREAGIVLGVVSQHRFDDSSMFLKRAIETGRLGRILQADAYVKWWRSEEYYRRPIKGSWSVEGGGAMINQAIHQVDLLLWLVGHVEELVAYWQLAGLHKIEGEDNITALVRYANGANGVLQAATSFWPGYSERVEIHGTEGTAIITGDKLTTWDVKEDSGHPAPVAGDVASGASDPMAISLAPFERQFRDFAQACQEGRPPLVSAEDGYRALQFVLACYDSCRRGEKSILPGAI